MSKVPSPVNWKIDFSIKEYSTSEIRSTKELLITGSKKSIKIWDIRTAKCVQSVTGHVSWVDSICILSSCLVASGSDKTIKIWNIETGQISTVIREAHNDDINRIIQISPREMASASDDQCVKVWDIKTGILKRKIHVGSGGVKCLLHIPSIDNRVLATGSDDGNIKIWNIVTGKVLMVLGKNGHESTIWDLVYLKRNVIASASDDGKIKIWDISNPDHPITLVGHRGPVFSVIKFDKDKIVSCGGDMAIKIWSVSKKSLINTIKDCHSKNINSLLRVSENEIASASNDRTVKVWDIRTCKCVHTLRGHGNGIFAMNFISKTKKRPFNSQFKSQSFASDNYSYDEDSEHVFTHFHNNFFYENVNEKFNLMEYYKRETEIIDFLRNKSTAKIKEKGIFENFKLIFKNKTLNLFKPLLLQSEYDLSNKSELIFKGVDFPSIVSTSKDSSRTFSSILDDSTEIEEGLADDELPIIWILFGINGIDNTLIPKHHYFELFLLFKLLKMKNLMYSICKKIQSDVKDLETLFVLFYKSVEAFENKQVFFKFKTEIIKKVGFLNKRNRGSHLKDESVFIDGSTENNGFVVEDGEAVEDEEEIDISNLSNIVSPSSGKIREKKIVVDIEHILAGKKEIPNLEFNSVFTLNVFNLLKKNESRIEEEEYWVLLLDQMDYLAHLKYFQPRDIERHLEFNTDLIKDNLKLIATVKGLEKVEVVNGNSPNSSSNSSDGKLEIEEDGTVSKGLSDRKKKKRKKGTKKMFKVKDLSFQENFRVLLKNLYDTKQYYNIKLKTKDGKIFKAHREVLVYRSNFFYRQCRFPGVETHEMKSKNEILIEFLNGEELFFLLQYIYLNSFQPGNLETCFKLLGHAEMYFEKDLESFLIRTINKIFTEKEEEGELLNALHDFGYLIRDLPEKLQKIFVDYWCLNFRKKRSDLIQTIDRSVREFEKKEVLRKEIEKVRSEMQKLQQKELQNLKTIYELKNHVTELHDKISVLKDTDTKNVDPRKLFRKKDEGKESSSTSILSDVSTIGNSVLKEEARSLGERTDSIDTISSLEESGLETSGSSSSLQKSSDIGNEKEKKVEENSEEKEKK